MKKLLFAALLTSLVPLRTAQACYWDRDTLAMERRAFPKLLALITGRIRTRSPELYRWRIADRTAALKAKPNSLPLLDDLAVAYDKLEKHDEAIAVATRALKLAPKRYETLANLGTFHVHRGKAGDYKLGAAYIRQALEINPNAHFGRERYQLELVRYLSIRGARPLPLGITLPEKFDKPHGRWGIPRITKSFHQHLAAESLAAKSNPTPRERIEVRLPPKQRAKAIKGVAGMLRFGNNGSPILLEALASLLLTKRYNWRINHSHLAAFALWRAAEAPNLDAAAKRRYINLGLQLAVTITAYRDEKGPARLYKRYQRLRRSAKAWVARRHKREQKLIAKGHGKRADALWGRR